MISNISLKHIPVRKRAPLTTRSGSLRRGSAGGTTLQNSTLKQAGQNTESISQEVIYHWILARTSTSHRVFEKLQWTCFSKVILESKITPNISRRSDLFSTVLPIVNGGDWGCIVRVLESIIVLVSLAFNFIPQRSHHSLTLPRSRIRESATVTLTPGDGTIANKVDSSA